MQHMSFNRPKAFQSSSGGHLQLGSASRRTQGWWAFTQPGVDYSQSLPNCNNTRCGATHTCAERQVINCYICPFYSGNSWYQHAALNELQLSGFNSKRHWKWKIESYFMRLLCQYFCKHLPLNQLSRRQQKPSEPFTFERLTSDQRAEFFIIFFI